MKKVILKTLTYQNFKGIRHLVLDLNADVTNIVGPNGKGKTTAADGYHWLVTGKNSADEAKFGIKTTDKSGAVIPDLTHGMEGVFICEGVETTFRREVIEKWSSVKGDAELKNKSNEISYYVNNNKVPAAEYQREIAALIPPDLIKIITDPLYFNSESFAWNKRLSVLLKMAGDMPEEMFIQGLKPLYADRLRQLMAESSDLAKHKTNIAGKLKKLKEEKTALPIQHKEVERTHSLHAGKDFPGIEAAIVKKQSELESIDTRINDLNQGQNQKFEEISGLKQRKFELEQQLQTLTNDLNTKHNAGLNSLIQSKGEKESIVLQLQTKYNNLVDSVASLRGNISANTTKLDQVRKDWETENAKVYEFNPTATHCSTCQAAYTAERLESERVNGQSRFDTAKQTELNRILGIGESLKSRISEDNAELEKLLPEMNGLPGKLDTARFDAASFDTHIAEHSQKVREVSQEEKDLQAQIAAIVVPEIGTVDTTHQQQLKKIVQEEIDKLKTELSSKQTLIDAESRMKELKDLQRQNAQQIADLEISEDSINLFNKMKAETIQEKTNELFRAFPLNPGTGEPPIYITYKMYDSQYNGGEAATCECMVDGVAYKDLNHAQRVNAGLAFINAATAFYGCSAPIMIDSRESVTAIIPTVSQVINLAVSETETFKAHFNL